MKTLVLKFDYLKGPIWPIDYDQAHNRAITGIEVIDQDDYLQGLNTEAQNTYNAAFDFSDYGGKPVIFNSLKARSSYSKLMAYLEAIKKRLDEINDGSFEVDDQTSEQLEKFR